MTRRTSSVRPIKWVWATFLVLGFLQQGSVLVVADEETVAPSEAPSEVPIAPVIAPTGTTLRPSLVPSLMPSAALSEDSTVVSSTMIPSGSPSGVPTTLTPTGGPSLAPTRVLSQAPSVTATVSVAPTLAPSTAVPTEGITSQSSSPSASPSLAPSEEETSEGPSDQPTASLEPTTLTESSIPPSLTPSTMPSDIPSDIHSASMVPSLLLSQQPTMMPSVVPTSGPPVTATPAPSSVPVTTTGDFTVTLVNAASVMDRNTTEEYVDVASAFLRDQLGMLEQPIAVVNLAVTEQSMATRMRLLRRSLQTTEVALDVDMSVVGTFEPIPGMAENPDDVNLGRLCSNFFRVRGTSVFLPELQALQSPYGDFFSTVTEVESVFAEVPVPTPAPSGDGGDDGGMSTGAIIGIAVAAGVLMALMGGFVWQRRRRRLAGASDAASWGRPPDTASAAGQQSRFFVGSSSNRSSAVDDSIARSRADSEELSYLQSDIQSQLGADTLLGADSASYAYSLDHGFDGQSVGTSDLSSLYGKSAPLTSIPTEIPNLGSGSGAAVGLVPQVAGGPDEITRECFAPPGKLGVVIDTTLQGPVIHTVNAGSPLEGVVWPGDRIIAIDDMDCRNMSATAITDLMVKTADKRRKLTILSSTS